MSEANVTFFFCESDVEEQLAAMRKKAADALPGSSWSPLQINPNLPPERADIVIVGGGVIGWSVAYWLKQKERLRGAVKVVVVEKDPTVRDYNLITMDDTQTVSTQLWYRF